jgi:copper chaperone NosL
MSRSHTTTEPVNQDASTAASSEGPRVESRSDSTLKARVSALSRVQILLLLGTALFVVSHFFLWWELRLNAPQFPTGLFIQATSYEIQPSPKTPFNDIREVDGLNHYIGMMSLGDAAQLEMSVAIPAIIIFTILGLAAVFWTKKWWAPLLAIPIVLYPLVYLADLGFWLWYAGNNLDPMAAITLPPFTPRVLGTGQIMQFSTQAYLQIGWYIGAAAGILCLIAIILSMKNRKSSA